MVPSHDVVCLIVLACHCCEFDHVFHRIVLGVDSCLCALDWQPEGVRDYERVAVNGTLHQAHNFEVSSTAGMHNHLQHSNCRYSHMFEVVRVLLPWFGFVLLLLGFVGVVVEGIADGVEEFDVVGELWIGR